MNSPRSFAFPSILRVFAAGALAFAFGWTAYGQQIAVNPLFNSPANVKARQVLQQVIQALGGNAFLKARYKSGSGRSYSFNSAGELTDPGVVFWSFARFPDADRIEVTKDRDVIYLFNGNDGWQITFRGVGPLKAEQVRDHSDARDHSLDMVLRRWVRDPETLMIYRGIEMADQRQVDIVEIANAKGEMVRLAADVNSHLPVNLHWKRQDPDIPQPLDESATFGNYQVYDGINTAMDVQRYEGEQRVSQRFYTTMSYAPLPDSLFKPGPLQKNRNRSTADGARKKGSGAGLQKQVSGSRCQLSGQFCRSSAVRQR